MNTDTEARAALAKLRRLVEGSSAPSLYGNQAKALADIDALLTHPDNKKVRLLLAPTGNVQELSMDCGWGDEFLKIADELERVLAL